MSGGRSLEGGAIQHLLAHIRLCMTILMRSDGPIRTLRANVSHEEALRFFTGGVRGLAANLSRGRARGVAELYIPYRLFRVEIRNGGREEGRVYALDSVAGVLDLFEFSQLPGDDEVVTVATRNALPCRLTAERAREMVVDKVRRVVFSRGFMRLRDLQIEATAMGELYFPYWVCFRGGEDDAKVEVMDAVRQRAEGGKVRGLVEEWLREGERG